MGCKPSKDSAEQVAAGNATSSSSKFQKKQSEQCVSNMVTDVETEVHLDVPMPDDEVVEEKIEEEPVFIDDIVEEEATVVEEVEDEEEEQLEEEESLIVEDETEEQSNVEDDSATSEENESIVVVHENIEETKNEHLASIVEGEGKFIDANSPNPFSSSRNDEEEEEESGDVVVSSVGHLSESEETRFESTDTFPVVVEEKEVVETAEDLMENKEFEANGEMDKEKDIGEAE